MSKASPKNGIQDGGWGWLACLASFWTNGVVFGIVNSFGVLFVAILDKTGGSAFEISWIGSICGGLTFFMSPFASVLTDKLGCRTTALIGSALAFVGVLSSSFLTKIEFMYITYGILLGLGFGIAYQPSLIILGVYFDKKLGIANGLATFGSAVFTVGLPFALKKILEKRGPQECLWFESVLVLVMLLGGLTFRPPKKVKTSTSDEESPLQTSNHSNNEQEQVYTPTQIDSPGEVVPCPPFPVDAANDHFSAKSPAIPNGVVNHSSDQPGNDVSRQDGRNSCCNTIDLSIWKERDYRIWTVGVTIGLMGYFVPFVHLIKHVNDTNPDAPAEFLILCLGVTSGIGRLAAGFISDHPKINPIHIQQLALIVIGTCTVLVPVIHSFVGLCALLLTMGLFDGAFVSVLGVIGFRIVGPERASQAIGVILGLISVPMVIGPPIAGILYDTMGNYDIAFISAGVPPILGACILFLIRKNYCCNSNSKSESPSPCNGEIGKATTVTHNPENNTFETHVSPQENGYPGSTYTLLHDIPYDAELENKLSPNNKSSSGNCNGFVSHASENSTLYSINNHHKQQETIV